MSPAKASTGGGSCQIHGIADSESAPKLPSSTILAEPSDGDPLYAVYAPKWKGGPGAGTWGRVKNFRGRTGLFCVRVNNVNEARAWLHVHYPHFAGRPLRLAP